MRRGGSQREVGREEGPIRLLHVDDDPDILELSEALLVREEPALEITTATGAEEALEEMATGSFECVVSDYDMPGTDGLELLSLVREMDPDLPFVLFTGKGSEEIASEAISAGVTDYLQKRGGGEQYEVLAKRIQNAVDRYRAERAVERARRWHRRLVEESTDVIHVVEADGTIRYTSPSVDRVLGYDPDDLVGEDATAYVHPEDREAVEAVHAAVVSGESSVPTVGFRAEHADGSWVTLESRSRALLDDPVIAGVVVYVRDVTGRQRRERALERYERTVEATGDAVYALDADGRYTLVNEAHESLTGYDEEEVLGENVSVAMRATDVERGEAIVRDLLRDDERSHETFEFELIAKGGRRIPVENHLALLTDEDGEFVGTTGVLREIGDRRERERELERYARIVGAMGDGVYALDADGRVTEFNDHVVALTGYDAEAIRGASPERWYDEADVERFERAIRELLSSGDPDAIRTVEATLHTADGEAVPVEVNLTLLPTEDGSFRGTVGAIRDVSERRERERELEQYQTLVETVPEGVFVLDEDVTMVDGNRAAAEMFGFAYDGLVGRPFEELIEAGVVEDAIVGKYAEAVRRLQDPEADVAEVWFDYGVTVDGEERVYETSVALRPPGEPFSGTVGVIRDVTERRERELELERYERIVGAMGDGVYALDADGRMTEFNEFMVELTGYDRETMDDAEPTLWHDEEDIRAFESAIRELLDSDGDVVKTVEATIERADGARVPIEVTLSALHAEDGEFRGTIGVVRDVTERKERERELEQYETIVETMPDGVMVIDENGVVIGGNETAANMRGYEYDELAGRAFEQMVSDQVVDDSVPQEYSDILRDLLSSETDTDQGRIEYEAEVEGERRVFETHFALRPNGEEFRGTVGIIRDVTERKERERELERYETIVEVSGDGMYALDASGNYTFVNDALAALRGYDREELLGEHVSLVLDEDDLLRGEELIRDLLESEDRRSGTYELDVVRPDGERIPVENHLALLPTEDGEFRGTAGVLRDISERKAREEELRRQNERLDRFASMVSHDLRNPLNIAAGRVQMERRGNDSENLASAEASLHRMNDIVEDVLSLARQGQRVVEAAPVSLARCAHDAWESIDAADASLAVAHEGRDLLADGSRLCQLFENLFRNAVEHGGADVAIRVGRLEDGFYVEDDGPGIPEAERDRVFEYGRSDSEDGTGFGLAIVDGIAVAHGWDVVATGGAEGGARIEVTGVEQVGDE